MSRKIKCPHCRSANFTVADTGKKELSAGKALIGTVIAPGTGTVIGAVMGKKGKATFVCNDCGRVWKERL